MLRWWKARKMRWAVREVNRRKIRTSEVGVQVLFSDRGLLMVPGGQWACSDPVCPVCRPAPNDPVLD